MQDTGNELAIILQLIDRVQTTVHRETVESFALSDEAIDATTYRLSMIGEHCKRLPDEIRHRHPDIPWREMTGLRNIVVHGYDNVSPSIIWQTATEGLHSIREMVVDELQRLGS
ncbi:HepT-like ribonuclease domain-containing protein [Asticcacaulis sp. EMRT-3]|uniref:HepT-like ribonuclease domain-containing protein n=1 Tax=Asticcacaulis sp. EMRT-3 TaxID=3040349 RepID=UPI0024AF4143|nr:HepT-like ribonuclease domain-containing protein [Asticcacaulis sp. EMRT-3]MDI7776457.1 DUF86 domain-containing protein [Asticcacaulis sp. EMRT-3]